jgi:ATP-binding cassette subfamily C protein CydC
MRSSDPLISAFALLRPRVPRLLLAIGLGVLSLASALGLIALSAWLITRAWQMPPVLELTVAVVAVRALAISRGVFHYCERLASHDTALRAAGSARERMYAVLAGGRLDTVMRRHSGELLTRLGADVDHIADALVRGIIPIAVAAVLAVASTTTVAVISPEASGVMAACLLVAGVVAPWLTARAVRAEEAAALQHHSARDIATMTALEHGPELRVNGRLDPFIEECQRQQRDWGQAADRGAAPAAVASAMPIAAIGVTVVGAVIAGIALANAVAPTTVAVLMLVPLAAFEASSALPSAAVVLTRARLAAARLGELTDEQPPQVHPDVGPSPRRAAELAAVDLRSGFSPSHAGDRIGVTLPPGARAAVTGPSGSGKTAFLMTLAGLLPPVDGEVTLDRCPLPSIDEHDLLRRVGYFAEDAHVFSTTVRDNLLVARGDCTDDELTDALDRVGLRGWLETLPERLNTVLIGGAQAVSAGQRRRLLLARAVVSDVAIVLLDEPTEHLDADDADPILGALLDPACGLFGPERTVVIATHHLATSCPARWVRKLALAEWAPPTAAAVNGHSRLNGNLEVQQCCLWRFDELP